MKKVFFILVLILNSMAIHAVQFPIELQVWGGSYHDGKEGVHDTTKSSEKVVLGLYENDGSFIIENHSPFYDYVSFSLVDDKGNLLYDVTTLLEDKAVISVPKRERSRAAKILLGFNGSTYYGVL